MPLSGAPPEPWHSFLSELDSQLDQEVSLCCIGGFAFKMLYGLERPTADIDFLSLAPSELIPHVLELAGQGSPLHNKYKVYLQYVTIVDLPDNSDTRLIELFPTIYSRLRLLALDPYDLALTKLLRNATHDREDVKQLAIRVPLDAQTLKQRYEQEMRPYLGVPEREDLTLELWLEMIAEVQSKQQSHQQ